MVLKRRPKFCLQETHLIDKDTQTESERKENDIPSIWDLKASRTTVFIPDKADFKSKLITRDKDHYTTKTQQLYIYICTKPWYTNFIKQTLLEITGK
jgi:hypothetical protein